MSNVLSNEFANNGLADSGGRLFSGALIATLILGILFWTMQYMIKISDVDVTEGPVWTMPDFVRAEVIEIKPERRKPLKKPRPPENPPMPPQLDKIQNINAQVNAISVSAVPVTTEVTLSESGFSVSGISEGKYLPIVKIAPIYPPIALDRGVEGHCSVMYTVTANGGTADIRVDQNDCSSSLFHRASIKAAERFKYKPTVRNGEAIEVPNVINRFTFKLDN